MKENCSRPDPDFCLVRRLLVAGSRDGPYGPRCFGHPQLPVGCLGDLDYVTYPNARGLKHLRSRWQKDQRVLSSDPKRSLTIEKNCLSRLSWEIPILPDFFPSVTFEPRQSGGCRSPNRASSVLLQSPHSSAWHSFAPPVIRD